MQPDAPVNLLNFDPRSLAQYFEKVGERGYRATQVIKWIHQKGVTKLSDVPEALERFGVQYRERAGVDLDVVPERIPDDFERLWMHDRVRYAVRPRALLLTPDPQTP